MRVYLHGPSGKRFEEKRGWYRVDAKLAEYLADVLQIEGDTDSPKAFDICTPAEAAKIDEREKKIRIARAQSDDANDLTTSDLRGSRRRSAASAEEPAGDRYASSRGAEPKGRARSAAVPPPRARAPKGARSMRPIEATS